MALEAGMLALKHIGAKEFRKSIDISEGIQVGLLGHADSRATVGRLGGEGGLGWRWLSANQLNSARNSHLSNGVG